MSNDLIPAGVFGEISTQLGNDDDFDSMASGGFLRRIDLKGKGALVDKGIVKPGSFCIVKNADEADDLGSSIDVMPIARRAKAIDMNDKAHIVVCYDRSTALFTDIEKRSYGKDSHCQWGASFLVVERTTGQLYELYFGSKSHRKEAPTVSNFLPVTAAEIARYKALDKKPRADKPRGALPVTLKSRLVENKDKGWSWFVIDPKPCSNAFTKDQVPSEDIIRTELKKFLNPDDGNAPEIKPKDESAPARAR